MNITVAQIKYKPANFEYNLEQIKKHFEKNSDLMIYPDVEANSLKSMDFDSNYIKQKDEFFKKISTNLPTDSVTLIGQTLIKNNKIYNITNGYFDCCGKKIYVSDTYSDAINCDIYILSKNSYYTKDSTKNLIENIVPNSDFIYVDAIMLADENVYAGQSFAKNKDNKLVAQFNLLEEQIKTIDFSKSIKQIKTIQEEEFFKILTFAIKEYCEITGFKQVLLGLSGGIDSALVAVLATSAIGAENVNAIMLPSKFSSEGSITDSEKLVKNLGIKVETIPIKPLYETFMKETACASWQKFSESPSRRW